LDAGKVRHLDIQENQINIALLHLCQSSNGAGGGANQFQKRDFNNVIGNNFGSVSFVINKVTAAPPTPMPVTVNMVKLMAVSILIIILASSAYLPV